MGKFDKNKFQSKNQNWETPDDLFKKINTIFEFTLDVCASKENTKCEKYYSEDNSCLNKKWSGVCWMNPPYKNMKQFIEKAYNERKNAITVCLIPARTNTKWWHQYCMNGEIYFICGRPKFKGCAYGLPQPLALVVFGKMKGEMKSFYLKENLANKILKAPNSEYPKLLERLRAVETIIDGTSLPEREELDCAADELNEVITQLQG